MQVCQLVYHSHEQSCYQHFLHEDFGDGLLEPCHLRLEKRLLTICIRRLLSDEVPSAAGGVSKRLMQLLRLLSPLYLGLKLTTGEVTG